MGSDKRGIRQKAPVPDPASARIPAELRASRETCARRGGERAGSRGCARGARRAGAGRPRHGQKISSFGIQNTLDQAMDSRFRGNDGQTATASVKVTCLAEMTSFPRKRESISVSESRNLRKDERLFVTMTGRFHQGVDHGHGTDRFHSAQTLRADAARSPSGADGFRAAPSLWPDAAGGSVEYRLEYRLESRPQAGGARCTSRRAVAHQPPGARSGTRRLRSRRRILRLAQEVVRRLRPAFGTPRRGPPSGTVCRFFAGDSRLPSKLGSSPRRPWASTPTPSITCARDHPLRPIAWRRASPRRRSRRRPSARTWCRRSSGR